MEGKRQLEIGKIGGKLNVKNLVKIIGGKKGVFRLKY
jgi:hypothetical protein